MPEITDQDGFFMDSFKNILPWTTRNSYIHQQSVVSNQQSSVSNPSIIHPPSMI
jgi:hypothetical protein